MHGVAALADDACTAAAAVGAVAAAFGGSAAAGHTSAVAVGAASVVFVQKRLLPLARSSTHKPRMLRQLSATALQVKLAACPNPCLAAHAGPRDPMAAW